ncbi:MAG: hypothetical protein QM451_10620 [Bacillota bacterium]|nr:hypothetical protein [Bacillota bacterium]
MNLYYHPRDRDRLNKILIDERYLPSFPWKLQKTSYIDGVKFYFSNDNWFSIRFSGTEPILRLAYETSSPYQAAELKAAVFSDDYLKLPSDEGDR